MALAKDPAHRFTNADEYAEALSDALSQIESGQYQTSWIKPDGATVGTIFNVHPTGQGLDWRTDLSTASRRWLLWRAYAEEWTVFSGHLPIGRSIGRVVIKNDRPWWQPV